MKLILSLLLLIPLTSIAAEHGGKPAPKSEAAQQASEHGGKAMEMKGEAGKAAEHAGTAAQDADAAAQDAGTAAAEGAQQMEKKASEHAGSPVK